MIERSTSDDCVVVGGGVVGLAVARVLARRGRTVVVLDRGRAARAATWAAGGMLAPLSEAPGTGPFLELARRSLALYPAFVADVEEVSGEGVGYRRCGKLLVAFDEADARRLEQRARWQTREGHDVRLLDAGQAREAEPALASTVRRALHLDSDGLVDNRRLGRALAAAARAEGVDVREGAEVARVDVAAGRARGVELTDGTAVAASTVVVAAGAWSGRLGGLPRPLPVRPVRGQMLSLAVGEQPLRRLIGAPGAYLIPRDGQGGRPLVVVGATEEEVGFQAGTDAEAIDALRAAAAAAVPALADAREVERWSGFRPGTPDHLPVIGPDPEVEGLVYATGHYRNGILLAPVTAEAVARLVEAGDAAGLEAFAPTRFDGD